MAEKIPDIFIYDITAYRGDDLSVSLGWKPDNVYADFTGSTSLGQIKLAKTDTVAVANFTITLGNGAGNIQFGLTAAEIAALGVGKFIYDIQITTGAIVRTYVAGKLKIIQDVSRV
jgi:hypothetical protein